jgi:hypothetical protein
MFNVSKESSTNDLLAVTDSEGREKSRNVHDDDQISTNESLGNAESSEGTSEKIAAEECCNGIDLPDSNNDVVEHQAGTNHMPPESISVAPTQLNSSGPSPLTFQTSSIDETIQRSLAGVSFEQAEGGINISVPTTASSRMITNADEETYLLGYDSDGEIGPFYDAVQNEMECNDEDEDDECSNSGLAATETAGAIPAENASQGVPAELTEAAEAVPKPPTILSEEAIRMMTIAKLKDELGRRGLSKSGVKAK